MGRVIVRAALWMVALGGLILLPSSSAAQEAGEPDAGQAPEQAAPAAPEVGAEPRGAADQLPAQTNAIVQGTVTDAASGEPLIGAEVSVAGTAFGTLTDVDGKYVLRIPAGTVDLAAIYLGYSKKTVTGVVATEDKPTFQDITLDSEAIVAEEVEVVVSAEEQRSSVAGALAYQRSATNVVNGISAEEISRAPDSNAGDAVRRVSSASLVDGKYVYVRGLGERYSTAQLDGTTLPTPEPEKRVLPMDIFPASLIESLFTVKSYTADLPGDFAGGLVDIQTKDIPEEPFFRIATTVGFNTNLGDRNPRAYNGGDLDWLGFDDGTRSLDGEFPEEIPFDAPPSEVARIHDLFDGEFRTFSEDPDFGYVNKSASLSLGGPTELFSRQAGYILGASYSINSNSRDQRDFFPTLEPGRVQYDYDADIGLREVNLGFVGGTSIDLTPTSRISLKAVATQTAEDEARLVTGPFDQSTSGFALLTRTQFVERTLLSAKLRGEHKLGGLGDAKLEWDGSYAVAMRDEPDTRETAYLRTSEDQPFIFNQAGNNFRFFSDLTDDFAQTGVGMSNRIRLFGREATLESGLRGGYRSREFEARRFRYQDPRPEFRAVRPEDLFTSENIAAGNIRFIENTLPTDRYDARELSSSAYSSLGLGIAAPLWLTMGLRVEQNDTEVELADLDAAIQNNALNADLSTVELMPTTNLQWQVAENQAVRAVASRTIVRPQFRELAPFRYDNYLESTLGNPFLKNGEVYNFDLRWSIFPSIGEILSVGAFYKILNDPIEIVRVPAGGLPRGQPEPYNGPSARNYGVEVELRGDLANVASALRGFGMSANASLVESKVDQDEDVEVFLGSTTAEGPEILSAEVFTNRSRPMYGQSPYLLNAALYYTTPAGGTTATFLYNGVGERLAEVGTEGFDDTYELARHTFDVSVEQALFETFTTRLSLENITDAPYRFRLGDDITREYDVGREVSLRLAYSF